MPAVTATAVALAGAAFLILASSSDARPRASHLAVVEFKQVNPCPATGKLKGSCPGYVVGHALPLCADDPGPLQWQTLGHAKESGEWEKQYCQFRRVRAMG